MHNLDEISKRDTFTFSNLFHVYIYTTLYIAHVVSNIIKLQSLWFRLLCYVEDIL